MVMTDHGWDVFVADAKSGELRSIVAAE